MTSTYLDAMQIVSAVWDGRVKNLTLRSAEIKNKWSYTSAPTICLHGMFRSNLSISITKISAVVLFPSKVTWRVFTL